MRLQDYDTSTRTKAKVRSSERITPNTTDEVREIVFEVADPAFAPIAGQCVGLLAPGAEGFGQKHHFRLYTVADLPEPVRGGGRRITLCVRRCAYIDEYSGERYDGIASNYLCDLRVGDTVTFTGPYGLAFEVPPEKDANLILIGMGTGIAPFRAFVRHLHENVADFGGRIVLFHGAHTGLDLLYRNDAKNDFALYYDRGTFEAITALAAQPEWSEDIDWASAMHQRGEDIWNMLLQPHTYVYVAGLEKIRDELDKVFAEIAGSESKWVRRKAELEAGGRWVELLY
jgi:ferredoxin--NADP+ reductase